jgi:hypothetical protein
MELKALHCGLYQIVCKFLRQTKIITDQRAAINSFFIFNYNMNLYC